MQYIDVDSAQVTIDPKNGDPYLHVRDKELFPDGFRARITNKKNRVAIERTMLAKYPDGAMLPAMGVTAPAGAPNDIPLGVSVNNEVVSIPLNGLPAVPIAGMTGAGKTVLCQVIADWAATMGVQVHVLTERPAEYAGLTGKHNLSMYLKVHDDPFSFLVDKESEWRTADPDEHAPEIWILDGVHATELQASLNYLKDLSTRARMWKTTIFVAGADMRHIPTKFRNQGNYSIEFSARLGVGGAILFRDGKPQAPFRVGVPTLI